MSLRISYFVLITLLHIALGVCLYYLIEEKKIYFILSEIGLLLSFSLFVVLFERIMRPIKLLKNGKHAITDKDFTIKYVKTGYKETDELISVYNAMIENLRKVQTKTVEQSHFLEKLIHLSPIGIIILDYDGNIAEINQLALQIFQIDAQDSLEQWNIAKNPLISKIKKLEEGSKIVLSHKGFEKYKCQVEQIIHKGFPRKFIVIEDLTSEILETEKKAYEKLIRMMAHEVNNSMGAINSILQTVIEFGFEHPNADDDLKESLDIAISRNNNLAKFVDNFADIIRLPEPLLSPISLYTLLQDTIKAWTKVAEQYNIDLTLEKYSERETMIALDAAQIERVISNALKNAIESIGQDGSIVVRYHESPIGFSIIDNGPGIDVRDKEKLSTPFYSTKTNGQGIGLMLSREIIDNHQGKLDLYTNPNDKRTYFEVQFGQAIHLK